MHKNGAANNKKLFTYAILSDYIKEYNGEQ